MQSLVKLAYPPQCINCQDRVIEDFGLCGTCWKETVFIQGLVCDLCGVPLPGEDPGVVHCDDCMKLARPWTKGRSALMYRDTGRSLVLALKHGDRLDLARPLSAWMAGVVGDLLHEDTVLVPVPVHPLRLIQRRFNQAAVLSNALATLVSRQSIPDLLRRVRRTKPQDGMTVAERFANQSDAIAPSRYAALKLAGRPVVLVDDVMTSGATLAAAAEACYAIGARQVNVLALARASKDA